MHFLVHRDLRSQPLIRWLLFAYSLAIINYLALSPWFESQSFGLLPDSIALKIKGDADQFIMPISHLDAAIAIHSKLFFNSLIGIVLAAMVLRTHVSDGLKRIVLIGLFVLPLVEALAVVLALAHLPGAPAFKAITYASLWICQFATCLILLIHLIRPYHHVH